VLRPALLEDHVTVLVRIGERSPWLEVMTPTEWPVRESLLGLGADQLAAAALQ
jgi:hypothetical protein